MPIDDILKNVIAGIAENLSRQQNNLLFLKNTTRQLSYKENNFQLPSF